ncbi:MAG: helix-turn-helix transcriptional regulator [Chloroflexi bacterium]|nr:helix-turn-helix transcriptional regulator [Chloroflexota bacterium]
MDLCLTAQADYVSGEPSIHPSSRSARVGPARRRFATQQEGGELMTNNGDRFAQRRAIGQRIREWRLKRELSQAEVARQTGITQASLSNYENGKRDLPLSTLLGVAAALNVSLGDLLDITEVIVVRDSTLGRAVEQLVRRPDVASPMVGADAAS